MKEYEIIGDTLRVKNITEYDITALEASLSDIDRQIENIKKQPDVITVKNNEKEQLISMLEAQRAEIREILDNVSKH